MPRDPPATPPRPGAEQILDLGGLWGNDEYLWRKFNGILSEFIQKLPNSISKMTIVFSATNFTQMQFISSTNLADSENQHPYEGWSARAVTSPGPVV